MKRTVRYQAVYHPGMKYVRVIVVLGKNNWRPVPLPLDHRKVASPEEATRALFDEGLLSSTLWGPTDDDGSLSCEVTRMT